MESQGSASVEFGQESASPTPSTSSAIVADRPRKNIVVLKTRVDGPFGSEQTIYLCGTSHVSRKSCEDVKELIQAVKPQIVMLELCNERRSILNPTQLKKDEKDSDSLTAHLKLWRQGQIPLLTAVYGWMLRSVADQLEIEPGEEFRTALHEAVQIQAMVSLGDRLVSVTMARTWAALSRWQKVRIVFDIIISGFSDAKKDLSEILDSLTEDQDALTKALKDLGSAYPSLIRPLLEERDEYMVWSLRQLASKANKLVAVVGAGHLKGIQDKWDSEIDIEELNSLPQQRESTSWTHIILLTSASAAVVGSVIFAMRWRRLT